MDTGRHGRLIVNLDWNTVGFICTVITAVWGLAMWQNKQFLSIRDLVFKSIDKLETSIVDKLTYHERHDDERFSRIRDDLWEVRVNAAAQTARLLKADHGQKDAKRTD